MAKVEVGAGALVAGAGLAVWGSFQPLFEQKPNNPGSQEFVVTSWTQTELGESKAVLYGVPVLAASVLLVLCAALVLVDAWLPGRVARAVKVAAVGAATLLAGAVWTIVQVVAVVAEPGPRVQFTSGDGVVVLVVASLVALVGAVLVQGERVRVPVEERPVVRRLPDGEERSGPA
ncbi:hypothetical protein [Umezawaea sp. NPDC059074]|uniref:hypothetical protein n=1 Tax=Umezawaea sp. NPDC059074 TaxID=3346716 RepID=UPI0036A6DBAD